MIKIQKIDQKIDSLESLFLTSSSAYKKSKVFFKNEPKVVNIYFVYNREEMNKSVKKETPDWFVGGAGSDSIVIFSPTVFAEVSNHSKEDFVPVLIHEIAHIFTKFNFKFKYPMWLYEGIAGLVANQYKLKPLNKNNIKKFSQLHDQPNWQKYTNYQQAYSFTKYLFKRFGKNKCFEFINKLGKTDTFDIFSQKIYIYFKIKFTRLESDWLSTIH